MPPFPSSRCRLRILPLPTPNCPYSRFLAPGYILAVVGACACLARWFAVHALATLSRLVCSLDFVSVPCSLSIGWLSVTTDALIVESSPWYVSLAFVVGHSHLPRTAHVFLDTYVSLHRRLLASPHVKIFT